MSGPSRRRDWRDLGPAFYNTGLVLWGFAGLMLLPVIVSALSREWDVIPDFLMGAGVSLIVGSAFALLAPAPRTRLTWLQGMLTVAVSWVAATVVCALPSWLSGHYGSYLDACFDVMSGFTTTGLALIKDLDHVSDGLNTWRHLLTFLGGQGMIVLALAFLTRGLPGGYKLYVAEGKDEHLMPHVSQTARAIWVISLVYLVVGTVVLTLTARMAGLSPYRAFLHGLWVYMAAWSTGGFAPQSQNILYYHSLAVEVAGMVFFVLGSLNFGLHHAIWAGNRREIVRNLEVQAFTVTSVALGLLAVSDLAAGGVYRGPEALFRNGIYQTISAHTTTGFMTVYPAQLAAQWGDFVLLILVLAMLLGGSASSTAGGFKGLRVGLAVKAAFHEIRRLLAPESAVVVTRFHFFRDQTLEDRHVRSAFLVIALYLLTFAVTFLATVAAGYPFDLSMFEAASATGNVGLSAGVASPAMPWWLKLVYTVTMWVGRLEFMAVLALVGYALQRRRRTP